MCSGSDVTNAVSVKDDWQPPGDLSCHGVYQSDCQTDLQRRGGERKSGESDRSTEGEKETKADKKEEREREREKLAGGRVDNKLKNAAAK